MTSDEVEVHEYNIEFNWCSNV